MNKFLFGIDVGGTTIKFGVFKENKELIDQWSIPTNTDDKGENILPEISKSIKEYISGKNINNNEIKGIGIGVPGPVSDDGVVNGCVNLGWGVVNVRAELEALTGIPVVVDNDANLAGAGELWIGGGQNYNSIIFVTLGTGVGGAIINNGSIIRGINGAGGEIGHINVVDDEDFKCNCGRIGCLETLTSATGIVKLANKFLSQSNAESNLRKIETVTARDVFDQAKNNDQLAIEIVETVGMYLGKSFVNLSLVTNPEAFVIGGGVSKAGQILIDVVKKYYQMYSFYATKHTAIELATLENDAGISGGAYLALNA